MCVCVTNPRSEAVSSSVRFLASADCAPALAAAMSAAASGVRTRKRDAKTHTRTMTAAVAKYAMALVMSPARVAGTVTFVTMRMTLTTRPDTPLPAMHAAIDFGPKSDARLIDAPNDTAVTAPVTAVADSTSHTDVAASTKIASTGTIASIRQSSVKHTARRLPRLPRYLPRKMHAKSTRLPAAL